MATDNTQEDLKFAEMYLDYVSRRSMSQASRTKAALVLSLIKMMDARLPSWRETFIQDLSDANVTKNVRDLFKLPESDIDSIFNEFLKSLQKD